MNARLTDVNKYFKIRFQLMNVFIKLRNIIRPKGTQNFKTAENKNHANQELHVLILKIL